jgi:hypothetical protein
MLHSTVENTCGGRVRLLSEIDQAFTRREELTAAMTISRSSHQGCRITRNLTWRRRARQKSDRNKNVPVTARTVGPRDIFGWLVGWKGKGRFIVKASQTGGTALEQLRKVTSIYGRT